MSRTEYERTKADLEVLQQKYALITNLLSKKPSENEAFEHFKRTFEEDFMEFAGKESSLANEALAVTRLQDFLKRLEKIVAFPHTFTKHSVAIGGGFSSGKSSFVNSFVRSSDLQLSVGLTPTTKIPSYVLSSRSISIKGFSRSGATADIAPTLYKEFSHDHDAKDDLDLRAILPFITVEIPLQEGLFEHIYLIDTPGYNPAGGDTTEDRNTAVVALKDRDALIWMIGLDATGTMPSDDLDFLQNLELNGLPLYVVLNKADTKSPSDRQAILTDVKDILADDELEPVGICAYSANHREEYLCEGQPLKEFLRDQNQAFKPAALGAKMKSEMEAIFSMYEEAIGQDEQSAQVLMRELNKLDLDLNKWVVDEKVQDVLGEKIAEIMKAQNRDFAPIKEELARVKEKMLNALAQVLESLVPDQKSVEELQKMWRQPVEKPASAGQIVHIQPPSQDRQPVEKPAAGSQGDTDFFKRITDLLNGLKDAKDSDRPYEEPNTTDEGNAAVANAFETLSALSNDQDGKGLLHYAAEHNAFKIAKVLSGSNPRDAEGRTPLHYAAQHNACETANVLIGREAFVNVKDNDGQTPLHYAIWCSAFRVAKMLIDKGGYIGIADKNGRAPLDIAKSHKDLRGKLSQSGSLLSTLEHVLKQEDPDHAKDAKDRGRLYEEQPAIAKAFETLSALSSDEDGKGLLHYAAEHNAFEIAKVLIGSNPRDAKGRTPLHYAAQHNASETAKVLRGKGAALSPRDAKGMTPLHYAAQHNALETAKVLIDMGGQGYLNSKDEKGRTPLHYAAQHNALETAKVLLDKGTNPNSKDDKGRTPLDYAEKHKRQKMARLLR